MSCLFTETLKLVQAALVLLKDEGTLLASPEDATYFRMQAVKNASLPPLKANFIKTESAPLSHAIEIVARSQDSLVAAPLQKKEETLQVTSPTPKPFFNATTRCLLTKIAPELAIIDKIPSDNIAKQIANRWKTKNQSSPLSILSFGELPKHKALLGEIAMALDVYFGACRLVEAEEIEKDKQWTAFLSTENLKFILICDATLWQLPSLRQFYKEIPSQGKKILGNIPAFLLPDLSLYLKDPLLKRSLWKAICQQLS